MKKKQRKKLDELNRVKPDYNPDAKKIVIISIIVVICFILIYLGTALVTGEISFGKKNEETKDVEIQNVERLAGETFEIDKSEYMMMYYEFDGNDSSLYQMIYENYSKDIPLYIVNLNSGFNKKYVRNDTDEYTTTPTSSSNLKVKNPTLIRIKDGKVVKYIEVKEAILEYFEGLGN